MDDLRINVLLPSANRPDKLERCLNSLMDSESPTRVVVATVTGDAESYEVAKQFGCMTLPIERGGSISAWNYLYGVMPNADYVVLAADDLTFHRGWLGYSLSAADRTMAELIGFNDLSPRCQQYASHWIVSTRFITNHLGGVMLPPHYKAWYADQEVVDIAKREGLYHMEPNAVVEHLHPEWGKAKTDDTYRLASKNHAADRNIYEERKAKGFPIDWPPVVRYG